MTDALRPKPLAGVRVLDLTRLLPGPMATRHLADMGADVIKLEDTGEGDYARGMGPMREGMSEFFRLLNRNKRAMRLDLTRASGLALFLRLIEDADVLVESFRPGVMDRLGASYRVVAARNPRIVYCSISGYGQTGPYAARAGHDLNYIAQAGVADQIREAEGPPVVPNLQIADLLGGALTPVMGILAALLDARASGRGRHVDVSMTDAVLAHAVIPLLETLAQGRTPSPGSGMLAGGLPCYGYYRTRDGRYMAVAALERKFWDRLCAILGCEELKSAHLAQGEAGRAIKARLAAIFAGRNQAEWTALFEQQDCCVSPVLRMDEALTNEQFGARGMVHDEDGLKQFALPLRFSEFEFTPARPAPQPGAHTEEVLREAGYESSDIERLRRDGVI